MISVKRSRVFMRASAKLGAEHPGTPAPVQQWYNAAQYPPTFGDRAVVPVIKGPEGPGTVGYRSQRNWRKDQRIYQFKSVYQS